MKKEVFMMGMLTVVGCLGLQMGLRNAEITRFDKEMKRLKAKHLLCDGEGEE